MMLYDTHTHTHPGLRVVCIYSLLDFRLDDSREQRTLILLKPLLIMRQDYLYLPLPLLQQHSDPPQILLARTLIDMITMSMPILIVPDPYLFLPSDQPPIVRGVPGEVHPRTVTSGGGACEDVDVSCHVSEGVDDVDAAVAEEVVCTGEGTDRGGVVAFG